MTVSPWVLWAIGTLTLVVTAPAAYRRLMFNQILVEDLYREMGIFRVGQVVRLRADVNGPTIRLGEVVKVDVKRGGCLVRHFGMDFPLGWMFDELEIEG